jgi:hypothetical protein
LFQVSRINIEASGVYGRHDRKHADVSLKSNVHQTLYELSAGD